NYINFKKNYKVGENVIEVDTQVYKPYRPVFSSIYFHYLDGHIFSGITFPNLATDEKRKEEMKKYASYSAGLQCYGLTQQAASYTNNIYTYKNVAGRSEWGEFPPNQEPPGIVFWERGDNFNKGNMFIPGDIIIFDGHTAIINTVVFSNQQKRQVNLDMSLLIEAASPVYDYRVINNQSLNQYINANWAHNFKIIRLQVSN
ncbi:MAG: hypothetical protein JXJ04_04310, partial [Spirochaetales bacterium]|nr:hypothetical protein [Spirochaetales bacterium]